MRLGVGMKNYLAEPKLKSDYKELLPDYQGPITQGAWGEVGGIPTVISQQMNKASRKIASRKFNQRRTA